MLHEVVKHTTLWNTIPARSKTGHWSFQPTGSLWSREISLDFRACFKRILRNLSSDYHCLMCLKGDEFSSRQTTATAACQKIEPFSSFFHDGELFALKTCQLSDPDRDFRGRITAAGLYLLDASDVLAIGGPGNLRCVLGKGIE